MARARMNPFDCPSQDVRGRWDRQDIRDRVLRSLPPDVRAALVKKWIPVGWCREESDLPHVLASYCARIACWGIGPTKVTKEEKALIRERYWAQATDVVALLRARASEITRS